MRPRPAPRRSVGDDMGYSPNSNSTSYLSVEDFLKFHDKRAVGQLANDDGTQLSPSELASDPNLEIILMAASGQVESALFAAELYSAEDIASPNGNSKAFIQDIVARLAMYKLFQRRDAPEPPATVVAGYQEAVDQLQQLSSGNLILSFVQMEAAGLTINHFLTQQEIINLNQLTWNCRRGLGIPNALRRGY